MSDQDDKDERSWSQLAEGWRADAAGAERLSSVDPAEIRKRAEKFSRTIRWRNVRELIAGASVVVYGVVLIATASNALRTWAGVATLAGALLVCVVLVRRGGNLEPPAPTASTSAVLAFERAQLTRQAELLERVWLWYLAPLAPGIGLSLAASYVETAHAGRPTWFTWIAAGAAAALFVFVGWLNARAARQLRAKAERADSGAAAGDGAGEVLERP